MIASWKYEDIIRIPIGIASMCAIWFQFSTSNYCNITNNQFDNLLLMGGIGLLLSFVTITSITSEKINYLSRLILRFVIGYSLFFSIYYQFWYDPIPDINLIALHDTPLKDIKDEDLTRIVNNRLPSIATAQAYLFVLSLALILSRRLASLGFIILVPVFAYTSLSNLNPNCDMNRINILLGLSIAGLLPDLNAMLSFWTGRNFIKSKHPFWTESSHLYKVVTFIKFFILIGFMVLAINKPQRYHKYYANNTESPIKGVWTIKDVELNKNTDRDFQSDTLFNAKKIYLSSSRYGKIRMNDTLSTFEYMVDPTNNQFELWNFYDFRKLDLKGKFEVLSEDTIRFKGKNAKDEVTFTMVLEEGFPVE